MRDQRRHSANATIGIGLGLALLLASFGTASAQTTLSQGFSWELIDMTGISGFYLYYAPEEESPRVYSKARRIKIADPLARKAKVATVTGPSRVYGVSALCAKAAAYNATGQESAMSNEVCAAFRLSAPVRVVP